MNEDDTVGRLGAVGQQSMNPAVRKLAPAINQLVDAVTELRVQVSALSRQVDRNENGLRALAARVTAIEQRLGP